jgi:hypothetical protein
MRRAAAPLIWWFCIGLAAETLLFAVLFDMR